MIEVPKTERNGMTVYGYIVKPHAGRPNRSMQHFFVNGRYVKSRLMQAALEEAYRNAIITGKYPSGAVFLELPLAAVDVNVHPAKTEVKFSQEKPVFEAVYIACKNAICGERQYAAARTQGKGGSRQTKRGPFDAGAATVRGSGPRFFRCARIQGRCRRTARAGRLFWLPCRRARRSRVPYTGYAAAPRIWEGDPPKHTFRPYPVQEPAPAARSAASRPEAQEQQSAAPAPQDAAP